MREKVLILGGDLRQITVLNELKKDGFDVSVFGFDKQYLDYNDISNNKIGNLIKNNDIIILGLPVSKDNIFLNTPLYEYNIPLSQIIENADSSKIIIGGMIGKELLQRLKEKKITVYDYAKDEDFTIKNVIPTVEGAISIAIDNTPFTLSGSSCLILGYGRIGKLLSESLHALKCKVTVSARKKEDFAWAKCYGIECLQTSNIKNFINNFNIIFNTIPSIIIDEEVLKRVSKDSLIIDLASKPGGVDYNYAKLLDIKTIKALALPGKSAPYSAGLIIKEAISNILNELGGKKWENLI